MKNFKRFTAAIAATLMAASLSVPMAMTASAGTISVGDPATGYTGDSSVHTYKAYQIFKGTLSDTVLSDIEWGNGVNSATAVDGKTLLESIKELTKEVESASTTPFSACESAADVADILAEENDDSALTKAFADVVAKYTTGTGTEIKSNATESVNVADGYYLIQDAEAPDPNSNASKTRFILRVAGNATINPKSAYPTVMKKVQEESLIGGAAETTNFAGSENYDLGDGYNDIADYDIGDSVPFKLYGTLPSNYDDYKQYYYCFTDTLDSKFTAPTKDTNDVKVYVDGTDVTTDAIIAFSGQTMIVRFMDLKTLKKLDDTPLVTKNSVITVEYTAVLKAGANIGVPGQVNGVNLTYSNNPNQESGGKLDDIDKGTTPDDGVIVFTYGIDINKYTGNINNKLAGAKFAIFKMDENNKPIYLAAGSGKPIELKERPGDDVIANTTLSNSTNGIWVSNGSNDISIKGLDAGTYYIEELEAPAGYNKLTDPIEVVVTPTYMEDRQAWEYSPTGQAANAEGNAKALTALTITNTENAEISSGKGTVNIENKAGSTLPSTGGIGTTIFYLGGGAMVAVAGIVLITKKRMGKNAE